MHTPGPWTFTHMHEDSDGRVFDWKGHFTTPGPHLGTLIQSGARDAAEAEANARLIAVAPELLWLVENCERYQSIQDRRDTSQPVASHEKEFVARYDKRKRAAIRKAKGD